MYRSRYREKALIWRRDRTVGSVSTKKQAFSNSTLNNEHSLVDVHQNSRFREYEMSVKQSFDEIRPVVELIESEQHRSDFAEWALKTIDSRLGLKLSKCQIEDVCLYGFNRKQLFSLCVFEQFMNFSNAFFKNDPLSGKDKDEALEQFMRAGFHAVGVAPCADGRLAHFVSYVLRLPYSVLRRKAHAGSTFDVSESVRNWVFIEHNRFRNREPNSAETPTQYLKIAVYHYSKADPSHQGCAAHGSDDHKAAASALNQLNDFRQAIENRFGCGSTVSVLLIGLNTDDDSLRIHVPNLEGEVCLNDFVETDSLYEETLNSTPEQARTRILEAIAQRDEAYQPRLDRYGMPRLLAWLIERNFSQLAYVKSYENGQYNDIGHAERFIGLGNGFEEVQLRNLTYYSYLDTLEEGMNDVNVGIKIFKGLNVSDNWPIPVIIRCDYDGRVPGSRKRAIKKARRIENAVKEQYSDLIKHNDLMVMCTLRDSVCDRPAVRLASEEV